MEEIKIERCLYCGSQQIVEAHLSSYGGATIERGKTKGSGIHILICKNCGSVLRAFIADTKMF